MSKAQQAPLDPALERSSEVDLREVLKEIWARKIQVLGFLAAAASISYLVALSIPNKYTSEALLAPRADGGAGGTLGKLASQYGGIAGLAGISLGVGGEQSKTAVAIQTLLSRHFFELYLYDEVLIPLMAIDHWDDLSRELVIDPKIYDLDQKKWTREHARHRQQKPSVQEAHEVFLREVLQVNEGKQDGFVTISVTHYSPELASRWATIIVSGINEATRSRDVSEAEKSIDYLREQRQKTNLVYLSEVFAELIEEQTKTVMLANASEEYVFQVIEPPIAPELKSEPNRMLIVGVGVLMGFAFCFFYALFTYISRKSP